MMPRRERSRGLSPVEFVDWLKRLVRSLTEEVYAIGTIDPNYTSGRPRVKFDGETTISTKQYPYLSSYTPKAGDRVLMIRTRYGYLILGKIM